MDDTEPCVPRRMRHQATSFGRIGENYWVGEIRVGTGEALKSEIDVQVGRRLRLRRVLLDIGVGELADVLAIQPKVLMDIENGALRPPAALLCRICRQLGVRITWCFRDFDTATQNDCDYDDDGAEAGALDDRDFDDAALHLLDQFIQIENDEDRKLIIAHAERLAGGTKKSTIAE